MPHVHGNQVHRPEAVPVPADARNMARGPACRVRLLDVRHPCPAPVLLAGEVQWHAAEDGHLGFRQNNARAVRQGAAVMGHQELDVGGAGCPACPEAPDLRD
jgi:hypothetical protein